MALIVTMLSSMSGPNNIDGPASSTLNAIPRFANTDGSLLANTGITIDNSNNVAGINTLTLGDTLDLIYGGTNAALVASAGGVVYSTASALAILAGVSTSNRVLLSQNGAAPIWSTATLSLVGNFSTNGAVSINDTFATIGSVAILGDVDLQDDLTTDAAVNFIGEHALNVTLTGATSLTLPIAGTLANVPPAPSVQKFTSGSGTYNKNYTFLISSGSATVGATYTNNGVTYTVYETVASATLVVMSGSGASSITGTLTKASGTGDATLTFSYVWAPRYLRVQCVGGGGGGGGAGTASATSGGSGGGSTFGSTLVVGNGGGGGSAANNTVAGLSGGSGGAGSSTSTRAITATGGGGGCGISSPLSGTVSTATGGIGGNSYFSGAAANPNATSAGLSGVNGGGGSGGGCYDGASLLAGGSGGGAGGYAEVIIPNPTATYAYVVGGGGAAGGAGTSGNAGGAGGAGIVIVTEYYI